MSNFFSLLRSELPFAFFVDRQESGPPIAWPSAAILLSSCHSELTSIQQSSDSSGGTNPSSCQP
jgi:hypothetical protein